jgi:protease PrsW
MQATAVPPTPAARKGGSWWRILLIGFGLYVVGLVVLGFTGNTNLFPTVALLGNFLVPVAYTAFFYQRRHMTRVDLPETALAFFYGGVLGVFAASVLENAFISRLTPITAFEVAAIEEFAKILGVLVVARNRPHDSELEGVILGAAAGMGFAALESTGYVFNALITSHGSLSAFVGVTLLRGLLSPVGHGTWTAILAGVLFRETARRRFRIDRSVVGAYLTVVVLHGLWDGLPGFLVAITVPGLDVLIAQALIGLTGLVILFRRYREALRLEARTQEV